MASTRELLFNHIADGPASGKTQRKVTIVGAGAVGLAAAYSILNQGLCSELALVDVVADKLQGEAMDLMHGAAYVKKCTVKASTDYAVSADSDLIIVTAGARQREGETRLELVDRNVQIFKGIVPPLASYSPKSTICVVSNPVDLMTYITHKLSGFPIGRVFGSGTSLDSSRFRMLVADRLGVDTRSIHGMIIGEHGDSSVACWSALNVGGYRLRDVNPKIGTAEDPENWNELHRKVISSAYEIIKAKGYTNWAIGLACANIAESVLRNELRILPLSVPVKGRYGIEDDVFLSLPAVLGLDGVREIVNCHLDESEVAALKKSATAIAHVQSNLEW